MRLNTFRKNIVISSSVLWLAFTGPLSQAAELKKATMYKPLRCGCCDDYAKYLEKNGFEVEVKSLRSLSQTKRMAGVPQGLEGCHTLMVDGYVIDGLVPVNTVNKLLTERPDIKGITLPGMPWGAPGMDSRPKDAPLVTYAFKEGSSKTEVYAKD
tara:strand:+ start:9728 stop:10192 length:465 start_codon:yes stop_codon:yes gene_type:complete